MTIITSYVTDASLVRQDPETLAKMYKVQVYDPVPDPVVDRVTHLCRPGKTVVLFSGSWRLNLNATYIEHRRYRDVPIHFHANTLFLDHNQSDLFELTLHKLMPTNINILHNDWWTLHRPVQDLTAWLDGFLPFVKSRQGRIICSLPLIHLNFNRLKYGYDDIAQQISGEIVHDSMIIVRN